MKNRWFLSEYIKAIEQQCTGRAASRPVQPLLRLCAMTWPPQIILLKAPTDAQIDAAVKVSVEAYKDETIQKIFTNGNADRADVLWRSIIHAGIRDGRIYAVEPATPATDGSVVYDAIAVWCPPGKLPPVWSTPEHLLKDGFLNLLAKLEPTYGTDELINGFLKASNKLATDIFGSQRERDVMYANHIATDPNYTVPSDAPSPYSTSASPLAALLVEKVLEEAAVQWGNHPVVLGVQKENITTATSTLGPNFKGKFSEQGRLDYKTEKWGTFLGRILKYVPN
ncbi:hypothetical protein BC834DRAFT_891849 [Gloeopeniophorella convolvens]|nr:hypothetical protein BC834DRAFT_891849 [Gloeopeniophorella convolvens]